MSEKKFGLKDIIEEIDETIKPLELVTLYITWKTKGTIEEKKLTEELSAFIDSITPLILEKMIDHCVEHGLINKDENGYFSKIDYIKFKKD